MQISSIVDIPKKASEDDLFGINKYEKGLIHFIRNSDTPITIAIQGEWGSGKTSLMNSLQYALCGDLGDIKKHKKEFYGIWINTWQYSLMNSQEETLISIVTSISTQILHIINARYQSEMKKATSAVLKLLGKGTILGAKVLVDKMVEGAGDLVGTLLENEKANQTIKNLREDIQEAINDCLEKDKASGNPKKGFLIFIDDLDRIDPPVAVQILELLKNIFDLEYCIFILAIDYDVVIKGLKPKFGELSDKNEREFRSFFDKIIQMPFSMPVASYTIDNFLIENLQKIKFLPQNTGETNNNIHQNLTTFCSLSVGTNPRSLKRLLNTVSLIHIISKEEDEAQEQEEEYRIALNFALICIQIAYPAIYKTLTLESNFKGWDENLARKLKLEDLKEEKAKLAESEEFDEEWEQVLYRICKRDNYLSNKAVQISQLLNLMYKLVPEGHELGNLIADLLSLSSVTDVQAFDKPKQAISKGPVLKRLVKDLLPLLKNRIRPPYHTIHISSQRIQSNAYMKFNETEVGFTVDAVKDYLVLRVWHHPSAFKQKTDDMTADLISEGFSEELKALQLQFQTATQNYRNASYRYPVMEKGGIRKGYHVPLNGLQFEFSNIDELMQKNSLEGIAEVITHFMDANVQLMKLSDAYNSKTT